MRSKIYSFVFFIMLGYSAKSQTVTIPDANFVTWLQANYAGCMSGNQMDTTCPAIINATSVSVSYSSIADLTGIQYFDNLQSLQCNDNLLTFLPPLPNTIKQLYCNSNQLSALPALPDSLDYMNCYGNQLTSLPALPNSLTELSCSYNLLTSLPPLPNALCSLKCDYNQLTSLPAFPSTMICGLEANNNNITCFPTFPNNLGYIYIDNNPFTCLPNYIPSMTWVPSLLAYPLCVDGDTANNPNGCPGENGITGAAYDDGDNDCAYTAWTETGINHIPFKLYDSGNNLIGQTYSYSNGTYQFLQPAGTYRVEMDTLGLPFTVQCMYPGIDSGVVVPSANPYVGNVNFDIVCKPGFDLGVQSIYRSGMSFPGVQHHVSVIAGDMYQWYNMNCTAAMSGQVQVTITGPVIYAGPAPGALTPAVAGNVYTYSIADFGTINYLSAFDLIFTTDITAVIGDQICVNVAVSPSAGDNNIANNTGTFCYPVVNSYDPNMKEVYPVDVETGFQDWLTYTIHFQNTGNAPAMHIRLEDTLDADLDFSTFQVINYSHFNTSSLMNNALVFNFPNIQLADSASDPEGSKGFVQYRIKPKTGLVTGTTIDNTAFIYFDYNPAIVTNTTQNEFVSALSVNEKNAGSLTIFPNPGTGKYMVKMPEGAGVSGLSIEVYNSVGELIFNTRSALDMTPVDLSAQPSGIYFVRVNNGKNSFDQRIIKQ